MGLIKLIQIKLIREHIQRFGKRKLVSDSEVVKKGHYYFINRYLVNLYQSLERVKLNVKGGDGHLH